MTTLILTEKPKVAKRIAGILSKGKAKQLSFEGVSYYTFELEGERYFVVPAAGHLIELDFPEGKWTYPVIVPPERLVMKVIRSKYKYLKVIKKIGELCDRVIVATDLDTEGSSIALEIIKSLGWEGSKEIRRMEFSSLTPQEIWQSFRNLKPFDYPRANAGWVRRVIDLEWGANVSRGLTLSARKRARVKVLSSGRVQGPSLALIVRREREIREFKPRKFYRVVARFRGSSGEIEAELVPPSGDRIWDREYAEKVSKEVVGKEFTAKVTRQVVRVRPPPPFDGTDMQVEVSRITGLSPRQIADRSKGIAQQLYEMGFISYIGTESQKYPKTWGKEDFVKMVRLIGKFPPLKEEAEYVLSNMRDRPVEGKKDDPAHPAIHVVGAPSGLQDPHFKVFEVIARRNLATLAPDAVVEKASVEITNGHRFRVSGSRLIEEGWLRVYPYVKREFKDVKVKDGEKLVCISAEVKEGKTQPPKRYTQTSIIKEMERLNLGTKNTRVQILDILRERKYIEGRTIRPTKLGETVVEVLEEHVPELTSPELTSRLEQAMREIELGKRDPNEFVAQTLDQIREIMNKFKEREEAISEKLAGALSELKKGDSVGKCPKCGSDLVIKESRYGRFVACSAYPKCDVKFPLYPGERVLKSRCECGLPLVSGKVKTRSGQIRYRRCLGNCERSPLRCSKCGGVMIPKMGRYGLFLKCTKCGSVNSVSQ